jgi:very-short-patch-repair endonuclease
MGQTVSPQNARFVAFRPGTRRSPPLAAGLRLMAPIEPGSDGQRRDGRRGAATDPARRSGRCPTASQKVVTPGGTMLGSLAGTGILGESPSIPLRKWPVHPGMPIMNACPGEDALLRFLEGELGCKFRRQYGVGAFVGDFYSPEIKLGIELDGDTHFHEGRREYVQRRQAFIESFGIRIIRFLNVDVYENLDGVMEAIAREITERRTPQFPPYEGGIKRG